jgi:predicted nucleic acid-binding protein
VAGELLLDSGALISLLDRSQELHAACALSLDLWNGPVISTEAVLGEAAQMLGGVAGGRRSCIDFFLAGGAVLVPSSAASLRRVRDLLVRHADLSMDYADATLVALAEDVDSNVILTTDRRAFGRYRLHGRRSFRILPTTSERAQARASARS